jgi:glycosyltransferase involved in cell wall biosynthesis
MADFREQSKSIVNEAIADVINDIRLVSAFNDNGQYKGKNCLSSISIIQNQIPSNFIFMNELDLIASNCFRKAAIGIYPPITLKGMISGVYFRPRFLSEKHFSVSNMIKLLGFKKMCKKGWWNHLFLMDEQRIQQISSQFPNVAFHLLPDPWDGNFSIDQKKARNKLNLPENRFIILQFGIGTRRKGIHLVVDAINSLPESSPVFLLCAGKLEIDSSLRSQLDHLEQQNRAMIIDRYVSSDEEKLCFCATDLVLLPYVDHYGSSSVLSRAAASGKPVIASDYDLTGWRVKHHQLGLTFQTNDTKAFRSAITKMIDINDTKRNEFQKNALKFSHSCSLDAFERSLIKPFQSN